MQEKDFILLLTKQFSGDITPVEAEDLQKWLDQSPDNRQLATEWQQVWDQSGTYTPAFQPDLAADFQKVRDRMYSAEVSRARVVPLSRYLLRAAAVLVFLTAAFWTFRTFVHPPVAQLSASAVEPRREVVLPDGSHVWLRQGATLDFPQKFAGKERRVRLHGEAYFDIAHQASQPFRVELPDGGEVEVLGTQFDVTQGNQENSVLVRSGRVRFFVDKKGGKVVLNPGDKATYNLPTNTTQQTKVASFNELAWQAGGLEFIKTPLATVVTDLEQYYHVQIVLRNAALRNCLHTAPLTNQPLEKVLQSLSLTYQLKVLHTAPGQYELVGGTCR